MKKSIFIVVFFLVSVFSFGQSTSSINYVDKINSYIYYKTIVFDEYDVKNEEISIKSMNNDLKLKTYVKYDRDTKKLKLVYYCFNPSTEEYEEFNKSEAENIIITYDIDGDDYIYYFMFVPEDVEKSVPVFMIKTDNKIDETFEDIKEFYSIKLVNY